MYDVVIVGAGIAGLYTGWKLSAAGWRVCILDRRRQIGLPVRCGEATGNRAELRRFLDVDESWIATDLTGITVHLDGAVPLCRTIPDTGAILRRDLFEQDLARKAAAAGAEIRLECRVNGLIGSGGSIAGVRSAGGEEVRGRMVLGADGPESHVGRWAGICGPLAIRETYSAAQYRLRSDFHNDGQMHFFVGSATVGPGYVWVFPRGNGEISVGAGLYGGARPGRSALRVLDTFLDSHLRGVARTTLISGCAPVTVCPSRLYCGTAAVVGDAARQVNPLTAGGIMNALEAADLLANSLISHTSDVTAALRRYSSRWCRRMRFEQKVFLVLQRVFLDCSDRELAGLLGRADHAFGSLADRSRPFRWPVGSLARLFVFTARKALRHLTLLVQ